LRTFRFLFLISCAAIATLGQGGRSTVSIGAGGGIPAGGYLTDPFSSGPAFAATYEFRAFRCFAPSIGVANFLPNYMNYDEYATTKTRERVTLLSLGFRSVLPLAHGRVELFAGPSATHIGSSVYELTQAYPSPPWLFEVDGGGRMAIDRHRHFWIGPTARFTRDIGRPTEEWVSLTGDVGFRF
jgi:hypothetical protein